VGPSHRVVVSSYSGDTWEAIALLEEAHRRGAHPAVISSGGALTRRAAELGLPRFAVPGGFQPRAALGWLFAPALAAHVGADADALARWGGAVAETAARLREEIGRWKAGESWPNRDPFILARALEGRFAFVAAPSERTAPVALRWKNQLLENAKQAAAAVVFPEAAHNEIMGW
jgi:glucose/mannose-6-phosphate isomerase